MQDSGRYQISLIELFLLKVVKYFHNSSIIGVWQGNKYGLCGFNICLGLTKWFDSSNEYFITYIFTKFKTLTSYISSCYVRDKFKDMLRYEIAENKKSWIWNATSHSTYFTFVYQYICIFKNRWILRTRYLHIAYNLLILNLLLAFRNLQKAQVKKSPRIFLIPQVHFFRKLCLVVWVWSSSLRFVELPGNIATGNQNIKKIIQRQSVRFSLSKNPCK